MTSIAIALIDTDDRLRTLDPTWVTVLAEEISADGLLEPIRVVERGERYRLIAGARRVAAHLQLGRDKIEANIQPESALADSAAVRLAEIKSHMLRGDLTALDRAVTVSAWCELYKEANGAPKRGPKTKATAGEDEGQEFTAIMAGNWSEAARAALDISERALFRSLKIARIEASFRSALALHPIAKVQRELLLLADLTPVRQQAVCDLLTAAEPKAVTVTEAIALLDYAPAAQPLPAHERIYERFVRLKPTEREKFFELNRSEIETWLAKRSSKRAA